MARQPNIDSCEAIDPARLKFSNGISRYLIQQSLEYQELVIGTDRLGNLSIEGFFIQAVVNSLHGLICIPTAGKLIDVMGIPLSISIYYFPFVFIFGDILTEVYGYAVARRVLWYCIFAQLLAIGVFEFVIFYPPSAVMTNNQSYVDVLSVAPRLVLFGTLAMFAGDIANNYVLAKMKVWTNGRYISARFVTSTLCGQMVNTAVFYIFGLWKMIPTRALTKSIVVASLAKVTVELLLLPVTLKISLWLKRTENVDYFDRATNFNPLKF